MGAGWDRREGKRGGKLGEKSPDLPGRPQPAPGSSTHLELGTGTLGQTSQSATPALQTPNVLVSSPGPPLPKNETPEQLQPLGSRAVGAAAGILREGRGSCSWPCPLSLAGVAQHLLREEPVVPRPTGTALLQPSDLQRPPSGAERVQARLWGSLCIQGSSSTPRSQHDSHSPT